MTLHDPVCCAPTGDKCGEGVLWHPQEQVVYWTDINRFLIHRYDPDGRSVKTWFFDEPVTAVLLTDAAGLLLVCLGSRVIFWESETDVRRDFGFRLPNWPSVRLNDAGIDVRGALWAGSMRNNVNADGSGSEAGGADGILYRIDPDGSVTEWERDLGISNTFVWNADNSKFYFGDSSRNEIWVYKFDSQTSSVTKLGTHVAGFARGFPDGSAIDESGYVWNCRWGGSCIIRVAPEGVIDRVVEMPTRNITNCTFGGRDLMTLYVTTAAADDRLAGSLFSMKTDVRGVPANRFRVIA